MPYTEDRSAWLEGVSAVTQLSASAEKIALFRSLFRGRTDVYPARFESLKTGKSGYQPACGNEWVRGVCEKPRIKCSDCPHQCWLPVTDEVVFRHLAGERNPKGQAFVMGVYPMLLDETCFFLAADFDGESWRDDARAFLETCRHLELPAALERSRSGEGGHVWLFFAEALSAALARKLGAHLLTETLERRPDIGFGSYDRFFPNQDTLPKGGFGNLIALPLQREARLRDNTVFLDGQLAPHADQWAFLASVQRIGRDQVQAAVESAEKRGRVMGVPLVTMEDEDAPWNAPPSRRRADPPITEPLPASLEIVLGDQIYLPSEALPRRCATGSCGSRRFRIPSFTGRRRCACPFTTSRASSVAPNNCPGISPCRAAASTRCIRCWPA